MIFTGERFLPDIIGPIALEHRHRYLFAQSLAAGKRVLDVACGEGYGSALLAEVALQVAGIDIDPETIALARSTYATDTIDFTIGSVSALPYADASFDLAVSFETLEHIDEADQERLLGEIRRVLTPGGTLVISTPNRLVYSDRPAYRNPFHLHERYVGDFRDLLARYFSQVDLYGQRVATASYLFAEGRPQTRTSHVICDDASFEDEATYVVAVCGSQHVELPARSAYFNVLDDTLESMQNEVARRERELRELQAEYAKLEGGYVALLAEYRHVSANPSRGTSPFRALFAPMPPIESQTLEHERAALRAWTERCREARLDSERMRSLA